LLRTWAINAGFTSIANNTEPGAIERKYFGCDGPRPHAEFDNNLCPIEVDEGATEPTPEIGNWETTMP